MRTRRTWTALDLRTLCEGRRLDLLCASWYGCVAFVFELICIDSISSPPCNMLLCSI